MRDQYKILSEKYQSILEQTEPVMKVDGRGTKEWYLNGKLHRTDGPAIEWANGYKAWYLNGKKYTEEDWKNQVEFEKGLTDLAKFRVR